MDQFLYYRSLSRSPAIWKEGKESKSFPSNMNKDNYLGHMKEGKGFPSIWRSSNDEDLERIALGIMLCRGHLDKLELIGFEPYCFNQTKISVIQSADPNFPLASVGNHHYELYIDDDIHLMNSIEIFLSCRGKIETFPKKVDSKGKLSILNITKKYIDEISEKRYVEKAREWIQKYDN